MRKLEKNTRRYFVNIFAEYILSKFKKSENTIIQVTDCENFIIVNGQTTSTNVLDLSIIKKEFCETFTDLLKSLNMEDINILDIIKYDQVIDDLPKAWVRVNKSLYVKEEDPVIEVSVTSEFPYGYSLGCGRGIHHYAHYMFNQMYSLLGVDNLMFHYHNELDENEDHKIKIVSDSKIPNKKIKDLILDVFDMNVKEFSGCLENYNLMDDILKPNDPKPYLVQDRLKDIILI
jgi:predicted regulator of amino acid metabolism with ACT domain